MWKAIASAAVAAAVGITAWALQRDKTEPDAEQQPERPIYDPHPGGAIIPDARGIVDPD